jgi:hypothetical protein
MVTDCFVSNRREQVPGFDLLYGDDGVVCKRDAHSDGQSARHVLGKRMCKVSGTGQGPAALPFSKAFFPSYLHPEPEELRR